MDFVINGLKKMVSFFGMDIPDVARFDMAAEDAEAKAERASKWSFFRATEKQIQEDAKSKVPSESDFEVYDEEDCE